ncbi:hypothetical protein [Pseudomonas akapageensis]|uniref:hypothetical protein n=1 Tax=Pseudomonas akapageensis TaxID=2609961 RepID=UPI001C499A0B|nr:hypothetical protein [Pseudomonas akapageensis]
MSLPIWAQQPAIQELLNYLVDRLDAAEKRGTKPNAVPLTEATWPMLYTTLYESEKEHLWSQIQQLHKSGWIGIKPERAAMSSAGYALAPKVDIRDGKWLRTATGRAGRPQTSNERWRAAVDSGLQASEAVRAVVRNFCIDIPGRDMATVVEQLNKLVGLAKEPLFLREVSAQLFWGMSKVLDNRQAMVAAILGLTECPFLEASIQLQVFLPHSGWDGVLFIENQVSFERAVRSVNAEVYRMAIVHASGFKGSAIRLRQVATSSLFFSSLGSLESLHTERFSRWLYGQESGGSQFWGDLDWAGLAILVALRSSFPGTVAWQPGYQPMLTSLTSGNGHRPDEADKRGQTPVSRTGCEYTDNSLIPALQTLNAFVDQEAFRI